MSGRRLGGVVGRGATWLRRRLLEPAYPMTAVEVREQSLGVVRLVREGQRWHLGSAASIELPVGTLRLSMTQPNVLEPEVFRQSMRALLERAGALSGSAIALVLPDPVARVSILPASEVKARRAAEMEELIRFRLRKGVPFEIRDARVSFLPVAAPPGEAMVLAAAIFRPVLDGYEEACASLGLHAGLIELASLTLQSAMERDHPAGDRLLVNWDGDYVSLLLTRAGCPLLFRTLSGDGSGTPTRVAREVANTVLYYRERLGGEGLAGAAVRCTALPPAEAALALAEPLGVLPEVLDPWGPLEPEDAAATQAVAAAAASVVGRAA